MGLSRWCLEEILIDSFSGVGGGDALHHAHLDYYYLARPNALTRLVVYCDNVGN